MSRRKSEHEKTLEGKHWSLIPQEPVPNKETSKRAPKMSPEALRIYKKLKPELESAGLLTALDEVQFKNMCFWHALYEQAAEDIKHTEPGSIENTRILNTLLSSFKTFTSLAKQFGLTPSARTAISVEANVEENEFI